MTIILQNLDRTEWMPKLSIVCVMGYIVGFAIGPGPVPWIWNTEFFKQSARAGGGGKLLLKKLIVKKCSNRKRNRFSRQFDNHCLNKNLSHFLCDLLDVHIFGWKVFPSYSGCDWRLCFYLLCRCVYSGFPLYHQIYS